MKINLFKKSIIEMSHEKNTPNAIKFKLDIDRICRLERIFQFQNQDASKII